MLVKIKFDGTLKKTEYETDRNLLEEIKFMKARGIEILRINYFDKQETYGGEKDKLIVISK